jgi:surface polysaccharide O-acyltransferase-like enzyme
VDSVTHTAAAPPPATGARPRVLAYDALRVFAILTVVAIHSFMPLRPLVARDSLAAVTDDLLHYAVPLFVFISGALVWSKPLPDEKGAYGRFMLAKAKLIGAPYLAWAVLYLGVLLARSADPAASLARAPGLLLTGHVWYHLYFVPMLLTFYALTPLFARALRRRPDLTLLVLYAVRIAFWPPLGGWLREVAPGLPYSYATHIATHLPHMALGAWFALRCPALPRWVRAAWPALLVGGTVPLYAMSIGATAAWPDPARRLAYPLGMAATVLGIAFAAFAAEKPLAAANRGERVRRTLVAAAALSFGVYFVHPLWLLAAEGVVDAAAGAGASRMWLTPLAMPVTWVAICVASYASAWLLSRTRYTAWLVGVRAPVPGGRRVADTGASG